MTPAAQAQYVYGVVPAATSAPSGTGIARRRLHLVKADELAAIVSNAPAGEIEAGRDDLMTHARILETVFKKSVVLPMRFGVVMPDEDAVREQLLEGYRDDLIVQLRELEGKVELHLRAVYEEKALMEEILATRSDIVGLSAALRDQPADAVYYERIELGQKVAEAVEQLAAVDQAAILAALEPLSVAALAAAAEDDRVAANLSFLVEEPQMQAFDEAVDALGRDNAGRLNFKYTGPFPAYSFVELPSPG